MKPKAGGEQRLFRKALGRQKLFIIISIITVILVSGCTVKTNDLAHMDNLCHDAGYGSYVPKYDCCGCLPNQMSNTTDGMCCAGGRIW
jgi:esterase/lipase